MPIGETRSARPGSLWVAETWNRGRLGTEGNREPRTARKRGGSWNPMLRRAFLERPKSREADDAEWQRSTSRRDGRITRSPVAADRIPGLGQAVVLVQTTADPFGIQRRSRRTGTSGGHARRDRRSTADARDRPTRCRSRRSRDRTRRDRPRTRPLPLRLRAGPSASAAGVRCPQPPRPMAPGLPGSGEPADDGRQCPDRFGSETVRLVHPSVCASVNPTRPASLTDRFKIGFTRCMRGFGQNRFGQASGAPFSRLVS